MSEKLLKITYHGAAAGPAKKLNAYLRMPSKNLSILRREIELYLFEERQLPKFEIRTFWIDIDHDEIEIVNQNDYEIFLAKCESNIKDMHMQIAPVAAAAEPEPQVEAKQEAKAAPTAAESANDPANFIIHDNVECDSCGVSPLIGFRYKCVQCGNFDLCQGCEAAHKHPEHMMVRMPNNNCPSIVDAYVTGPASGNCHRRSSRRSKGQCPFGEAAANAASSGSSPAAGDSHKDSRRERRHARRHGGVLSQFMEMMMNMPESNTNATPTPTATPTKPAETKKATQTARAEEAKATQTAKAEEAKATQTKKSSEEKSTQAVPAEASPAEAAEPVATAKLEEPVAAPRAQEQAPTAAPTPTSTPNASSTPTTPVINLENLSQMVPPEYMRAGIEILNNFSEMFAKMLDPADGAAVDLSTRKNSSASSTNSESSLEPLLRETEAAEKAAEKSAEKAAPIVNDTVDKILESGNVEPQEPRQRSESFEQEWQMIDNNNTSASAPSMPAVTTTDEVAQPLSDFRQLGELLRQHITEEQQRDLVTAHTQTAQVDTVSTSTSTNLVKTNSTSTSTNAVETNTTSTSTTPMVNPRQPEEKRSVPIYHTDERINAAIHAMMAMGFSNEGAWLTQLLESVDGNIAAALDIMHTSQSNRN